MSFTNFRRLTRSCASGLLLSSLLGACAAALSGHAHSAADLSLGSLYPLHVGCAWSYDVESGDGDSVLATARVLRVQGDEVELQTGQTVLRYLVRPAGIMRVGQAGFLLTSPLQTSGTWASAPEITAHIATLHAQLVTPAGTFQECLVVQEDNARTGQSVATTYCPGVGPARVVSQLQVRGQTLRVTALLRGFSAEAP
jgi:hypothetical protein